MTRFIQKMGTRAFMLAVAYEGYIASAVNLPCPHGSQISNIDIAYQDVGIISAMTYIRQLLTVYVMISGERI
jgi:hypothetical protein